MRKKIQKKSAVYNKNRRATIRRKLYEYVLNHSCMDCKETDPIVLQFDHVRGKKKKDISLMVSNGCSWNSILLEIFKCDIVCANCHQRRTSKAQKWYASLDIKK